MAEHSGTSSARPSGSGNRDGRGGESSSAQKHKSYKYAREGGGGERGGRGDRGRGGRGRGRVRDGASRSGADGETPMSHLGSYRDDPLPDIMTCPGIVATAIQNKERSAERELIDYLERVADELYPGTNRATMQREMDDSVDGDLEEMLKRELADMSVEKRSARFRLCRHDTPCVIYINVLPPLDADRLVRYILDQVERNARCPFKYARRLIPIAAVGNATLNQLGLISQPVIERAFATAAHDALKFAIQTNSRSSDRLQRLDMIKTVADQVVKLDAKHNVDLEKPDRTILIELYKNTIGISVVQDYDRYKKYNPWQIAEHAARDSQKVSKESAAKGQELQADGTPSASPAQNPKRRLESRERKAASMQKKQPGSPVKRKANLLEDGQVERSAIDVESGEVVEDEGVDLGDDFEEVIEDGRVVKMRRVEDD